MKIALLCSGLGNIRRGHEIFAKDLFELIGDAVDITIFKGGGNAEPKEIVIDNVPRNSEYLDDIKAPVAEKWLSAVQEGERVRIEAETFAYASLKPLLSGNFDVIHCLEQEVCTVIYNNRHLFRKTPKILFSNGGAIPAAKLPPCDFVQEHTEHNLKFSDKRKSFYIPHGVDTDLFKPKINSNFRAEHSIPQDALLIICVGTICYSHKRTDYVIREVSKIPNAHLLLVGQENPDTEEILNLGKTLLENRLTVMQVPHDQLPDVYAAADIFTLGSTFEAFGIVYIEAMAMGLPVICTQHPNQRSIVKNGIFIDMQAENALTSAINSLNIEKRNELREAGVKRAKVNYDLQNLKQKYIAIYQEISLAPSTLEEYSFKKKISANIKSIPDRFSKILGRQAE